MKISKELPQFDGEKALVLVTGMENAKIFVAENGTIEEVESFRVEKPHYSDREGHFETRKGGKVIGSGSVYEEKDETTVMHFAQELESKLVRFRNESITKLFLFTPGYIVASIRRAIPLSLIAKTEGVIKGNFLDYHPFDLLKKIEKMKPLPTAPMTAEAEKTLTKSDQAKHVIRRKELPEK
jgi:hypothetical protein